MRVTNRTLSSVVVFIWHNVHGYGPDVIIGSGETVEVFGPRITTPDHKRYRLTIKGAIFCEMNLEDNQENHFQIMKGCPLVISDQDKGGVVLRHIGDERPFNPN